VGILIFQIVIALIIYAASQAGKTAKTITIIILLLFTLVMVKTSALMGLQFITIIICSLVFRSKSDSPIDNYATPSAEWREKYWIQTDDKGRILSRAEKAKIRQKKARKEFKEKMSCLFQGVGCWLIASLIAMGLFYVIFSLL
jgi:hypothetical protein